MADPKHMLSPELLNQLQKVSYDYFVYEYNKQNGLVRDKTLEGYPSSIAAIGMALTAYPIGVRRGFTTREEAARLTAVTLRFLYNAPQGAQPDATGYRGFFYHFLDMDTGRRVWNCELSTVDTGFLICGAIIAAQYFDGDSQDERDVRDLADKLYRRVDWAWAMNGGPTMSHGWRPEGGFLPYRWEGYDEAILLYILALGSPTHPVQPEAYAAFTQTYTWKNVYGTEYLYAGPLFIHQYSHMWIDFRGIRDATMRDRGIDYFENSRRATYIHRQYAIKNPNEYVGYGENCWGLTASGGPGNKTLKLNGVERVFYDYVARGVPYGPDDGTIAPWGVVASLPFAPEIVVPAVQYFDGLVLRSANPYGYKATFNQTWPERQANANAWVHQYHFGINQGPVVIMIENYRDQFTWNLVHNNRYIVTGLRRAGYKGGWLEGAQ